MADTRVPGSLSRPLETVAGKSILFVQYGDFGAAFKRLEADEGETYRDQRASVDFVANLSPRNRVDVLSLGQRSHDETLAPGLRSIGRPGSEFQGRAEVARLLSELAPDLLVCRTPRTAVLDWAARARVPTLPVFADLFVRAGLRGKLGQRQLRTALGAATVPCVANHSRNASLSLHRVLGIPPERIVPWDWSVLPVAPMAKPARAAAGQPLRLFYAGALSEAKGLGDLIAAAGLLSARGVACQLDCAGPGETASWQARAESAGAEVRFLGLLSHAEVTAAMGAADAVVVPSRHDYAEGLPNTIYEALASRTPLVISDHPAFAGRLVPDQEALVFRAADPGALATALTRLAGDAALAARLSGASAQAHARLYFGCPWTELIAAFLADPGNSTGWVAPRSLHAMQDQAHAS